MMLAESISISGTDVAIILLLLAAFAAGIAGVLMLATWVGSFIGEPLDLGVRLKWRYCLVVAVPLTIAMIWFWPIGFAAPVIGFAAGMVTKRIRDRKQPSDVP